MAANIDHYFAWKAEATPGTAVTPDKLVEWVSGDVGGVYGAPIESQAIIPSHMAVRYDRVARPGLISVTGQLVFEALTKGNISAFLSSMMGSVATTGPSDTSAYTHTGSLADLRGKTITIQKNVVDTTGTNHAYTYAGCKIGGFTLTCQVGGPITIAIDIVDGKSEVTNTAAVSVSPVSGAYLYHWANAANAVSIAGSAVNAKSVSCSVKFPTDGGGSANRFIGNVWRQALVTAYPEVMWTVGLEYDATTYLDMARATTRSAGQASFSTLFTGDVLAGAATAYASLTLTSAKCDVMGPATVAVVKGIPQIQVSAKARYDASNNPLTFAVVSADSTP